MISFTSFARLPCMMRQFATKEQRVQEVLNELKKCGKLPSYNKKKEGFYSRCDKSKLVYLNRVCGGRISFRDNNVLYFEYAPYASDDIDFTHFKIKKRSLDTIYSTKKVLDARRYCIKNKKILCGKLGVSHLKESMFDINALNFYKQNLQYCKSPPKLKVNSYLPVCNSSEVKLYPKIISLYHYFDSENYMFSYVDESVGHYELKHFVSQKVEGQYLVKKVVELNSKKEIKKYCEDKIQMCKSIWSLQEIL